MPAILRARRICFLPFAIIHLYDAIAYKVEKKGCYLQVLLTLFSYFSYFHNLYPYGLICSSSVALRLTVANCLHIAYIHIIIHVYNIFRCLLPIPVN